MSSCSKSLIPVVVDFRRTPIGLVNGRYARIPAEELLATVLRAVREVGGASPSEVIVGNATGGGGNVARLGLLSAGYSAAVPGLTIDRQCSSGLDAVVNAARMIASGQDAVFLVGGVESCSTRPLRARRPDSRHGTPEFYERPRFAPAEMGDPDLGMAADTVAQRYGISRQAQDAYALESHRRATNANSANAGLEERVPTGGVGDLHDEGPRSSLLPHTMSRFNPAFTADGSVTAGNSCRDADGAAVAVVMSALRAERLGHGYWLEFDGAATTGVEPGLAGIAGGMAARALGEQLGVQPKACAAVEFNEAFAAQVLASAELIGVEAARLNRDGGALAIGHPYGASGAVLVGNLFRQLKHDGADGARGLAAVSAAGGLGTAAMFHARFR